MYVGPGPARYGLPSLTGKEGHSPTKKLHPAYSFGKRLGGGCKLNTLFRLHVYIASDIILFCLQLFVQTVALVLYIVLILPSLVKGKMEHLLFPSMLATRSDPSLLESNDHYHLHTGTSKFQDTWTRCI